MPVLPPEPDTFPDNLFADDFTFGNEHIWWVLHTRPRQEKSLARHLWQLQVPFYLPLIAKRGVQRGRILTSYVPLFTSYIFLHGRGQERLVALESNRVVQTLDVIDQDKLWHDLRQVWRLIRSGAPITPETKLEPGVFVEIQQGALAGLKGRIIREATGRRFVVQVDFIQRGASVTLDDFTLIRDYRECSVDVKTA